MVDEVDIGVARLVSFMFLKLLGVNVVLRRFLFGGGGWRFLITCKYCQHNSVTWWLLMPKIEMENW